LFTEKTVSRLPFTVYRLPKKYRSPVIGLFYLFPFSFSLMQARLPFTVPHFPKKAPVTSHQSSIIRHLSIFC